MLNRNIVLLYFILTISFLTSPIPKGTVPFGASNTQKHIVPFGVCQPLELLKFAELVGEVKTAIDIE